MPDLYGKELEVLTRALDLRSQRNNLITANIANADTPGYKAVKIKFEELLKGMVQVNGEDNMQTTHPEHFPVGNRGQGEPKIVSLQESDRRDENSVDMDKEMVELTANQILYNANVEALNRIFALHKYAIEEGGF